MRPCIECGAEVFNDRARRCPPCQAQARAESLKAAYRRYYRDVKKPRKTGKLLRPVKPKVSRESAAEIEAKLARIEAAKKRATSKWQPDAPARQSLSSSSDATY